MASGSLLRGPIPTWIQDLRCSTPRCYLTTSKQGVLGGHCRRCSSAVPDFERRLPKRDLQPAAFVSRRPCAASSIKPSAPLLDHHHRVKTAAAASATAAGGAADDVGSGAASHSLVGEAQRLSQTLANQASRFWALSGKFMPMVGLFFMLAFVNTILDSLKDTLVITAAGGGAQVIPYLTVYAVLPSSLIFLVLYSYASQRFRRQALFNGIVTVFMTFFVTFAFLLYPNHQLLHPSGWAEGIAAALPLGLDGAVGMIRNWTFTLFFCISELWGDVCLGLLFWGLANETTSLTDAPTLYPLFGLGANVAQALAGFVLKFFSGSASHSPNSFTSEVQALMCVVLVFSILALALHHGISVRDNRQRLERRQQMVATLRASRRAAAAAAAMAADATPRSAENQMQPVSAASTSAAAMAPAEAAATLRQGEVAGTEIGDNRVAAAAVEPTKDTGPTKRRQSKQNLSEIYRTLAVSVPIRCLVVMSMAQGLCSNLMEFAWKSHIRLLYPTPAAFTSFLGDVSTWQGIVTGLLMVLSPTMFERMGWAGVAAATPKILLYGGGLFFATAMVYQFLLSPTASAAASAAGAGVLQMLVYGGALLYVFSKSAKFSLFKPAEEMVYISLDEEGRTKGKAAIDVVGSQAGKSGGSVLQQVLLLLCGGAIAGQLPMMVAVYLAMSQSWLRSVATLSRVNNYGHASSVHESIQGDSMQSSLEDMTAVEKDDGRVHGDGSTGGSSGSGNDSHIVITSNGTGHKNNHMINGNGNGNSIGYGTPAQEVAAVGAVVPLNGHINGHSNGHVNGYSSGHHVVNGLNGNGMGAHHYLNGLNGHANGYTDSHNSNGNGGGTNGYTVLLRDAPQPAAA
ncbi:hypothetical protein VaNZ11_013164 [Volvox africanus]|uniref:ADP,ATP carrier protein n=1 Tax=Volvox africanus TaxID=51714 RepID=A0ABQ5SGV2_9CHLO|nr:hypothetical protein VaNZ11_013164 [Volvox africanus]